MLWSIFAILTLSTLAALILPLLRRASDPLARGAFDVAFHRDQLAELERDQERGVIPADLTDAARTEIHRRLLTAEPGDPSVRPGRRSRLPLVLLLGLCLPLAAGGLYHRLGTPALPGQPYAARQSDPVIRMTALTDQLAARLALQPNGEGYRRLGLAYVSLARPADAVEAFRHADEQGVGDGAMLSAWGEAVVTIEGGAVVPTARRLFLRAISIDPENPQAQFYLGLAEAQIGDFRKALEIWTTLEKASAEDAPWMPVLREHIAEAKPRQDGRAWTRKPL